MKLSAPVNVALAMIFVASASFAAESKDLGEVVAQLSALPSREKPSAETLRQSDAYKMALAPHEGDAKLDVEIRQTQSAVRESKNPFAALERLGWQYVAKSRASFDPGYMALAEQCALALEVAKPGAPEALVLHGHVLHAMHRFHEAEEIARAAVKSRGSAFDYGLLGDALMEQGNLADAGAAYQSMLDLKPCLQSYTRAAHLAWLEGDLDQARALLKLAARAISVRDPEPAAWVYSRLATYEFQAGEFDSAMLACQVALKVQPNYAPALLIKTRILLAENKPADALACIRVAEVENPLPEYQWLLADVLQLNGQTDESNRIESELRKRGAVSDNRTLALFLGTRHAESETALRLATAELGSRQDVFTHDAIAWANLACGKIQAAREESEKALAEGTQDARLFLHAGTIALAAGEGKQARAWLDQSFAIKHMLFPSEQIRLLEARDRLQRESTSTRQEEVER